LKLKDERVPVREDYGNKIGKDNKDCITRRREEEAESRKRIKHKVCEV